MAPANGWKAGVSSESHQTTRFVTHAWPSRVRRSRYLQGHRHMPRIMHSPAASLIQASLSEEASSIAPNGAIFRQVIASR
jgi:hypothetical protein